MKHQLVIAPPNKGFMPYAQRVYNTLSPLNGSVEVDVLAIRAAARMNDEVLRQGDALLPPFRCPHHTVSAPAMCGMLTHGWKLTPGEVSLAHGGVLMLDGLEDFSSAVREVVWGAMRNGFTSVRGLAGERVRVPARFLLIARVTPQVVRDPRELISEALHNQITLLNEQDLAEALT